MDGLGIRSLRLGLRQLEERLASAKSSTTATETPVRLQLLANAARQLRQDPKPAARRPAMQRAQSSFPVAAYHRACEEGLARMKIETTPPAAANTAGASWDRALARLGWIKGE